MGHGGGVAKEGTALLCQASLERPDHQHLDVPMLRRQDETKLISGVGSSPRGLATVNSCDDQLNPPPELTSPVLAGGVLPLIAVIT